jgi:PAS domain-containing protein
MNVIDCKENILSGSVPPERKEQPAEGPENSDVAKINARLESENARLAQENVRLEQKYDLLRTLIDSLPDNIFIKNRQSRFLVNNLAHVRTLGATHQDEVLGKSDLDIFPAELASQYYEDDQSLMKSGRGQAEAAQRHGGGGTHTRRTGETGCRAHRRDFTRTPAVADTH